MSSPDPKFQSSGGPTLGVVAVSSPDYIRMMLDALQKGQVTVPLRTQDDNDRIARSGVAEIQIPDAGSGWIRDRFRSPSGAEAAMISFTSGTEGVPKAVYLSQTNLHNVVTRLQTAMGLTDEVREYVGVPVYHSFGYARCRAVLDAGGQCYLPEAGFDLAEIRRMLQAREINAISAVPSLWRLFLKQRDKFGDELQKVRWIEIGSQYMSAAEKNGLREAMPGACILQHYGLTEASRSTFLRIDQVPEKHMGSVGKAEGQVETRLDPNGRIEITGPHIAMGIDEGSGYRAIGSEAWLTTSDLGHLEDDFLYFDGRADDVINCAGIKLIPDLMEAALHAAVPGAGDFGILRTDDTLRGDGVMLALSSQAVPHVAALTDALDAYMIGQGLSARGSIITREIDTLPRTPTGKLQRKALGATLAAENPQTDAPTPQGGFEGFLRDLLGTSFVLDTSFSETGGDSLAHMQVQLALERTLGTAPPNWETQLLAQLINSVDEAGDFELLMQDPGGAPPLPRGERNCNPEGLSFWALVREDYLTNDASVFHQGFLMLLIHRFGNWRMDVQPRLLRAPLTLIYRFLNKMTQLFFGMKLDYTVKVGRRVKLEHFSGMILGARAIGDDVILRQNTTMGLRGTGDLNAKPTIGNRVDIGAGAVIVGNITVGDNTIVGANTVVYTNVPENSVISGVPGRIIGKNARQNHSPLAPSRARAPSV